MNNFTRSLLSLLFVISSVYGAFAQITVGSGTASGYVPVYTFYGYNYSQQIYLQSEINGTGDITSLTFTTNLGSSSMANSNGWTIYIGHTTKTSFTSTTDWVPVASMTQVFSGTVTFPAAAGTFTVTLTTPFTYNNTDNLVIAVDENTASYGSSSSAPFKVWTASGASNRSILYRNDTTNPDPASPPTATTRYAYIPITTFGGLTPPGCSGTPTGGTSAPASQSICTGATPANLVVTGASSAPGITYQWQESDDNGVGDPWASVTGGSGATTTTYTPPAFSGTSIYYRLLVTCTNSGNTATSSVSSVSAPTGPGNTTATTNPLCASGLTTTLGIQNAAPSGSTYQWESSATSGSGFAPISGAMSATYVATVTANTYYRCVVTCSGGASLGTSNELLVSLSNAAAPYCTPYFGLGCSSGDNITNVVTGTLSNSSTCAASCTYNNFLTGLTVPNLERGSNQSVSVTVGSGGTEYVRVFVDFNQDGDFGDTGEDVLLGSGNGITITNNVPIPAGATLGNTRMRVMVRYNNSTYDACYVNSSSYGETEDYTVNIVDPLPIPPTCPSTFTPANGATGASWPARTLTWSGASGSPTGYRLTAGSNSPDYDNLVNNTDLGNVTTYNLTGLSANTTYGWKIIPYNANGDATGCTFNTFTTTPNLLMQTGTVNFCGGNFYDTGGSAGNYGYDEDNTITICPVSPSDKVTINFSAVSVETGYDYLKIYNGTGISTPLNTNLTAPASFTSTTMDGCLTVVFTSDDLYNYSGWTAAVSCAAPPTCPNPSTLTSANVTATSADLNWTENGSATAWDIYLSTSSTTPLVSATPTYNDVSSNPYGLTSLMGGTTYYAWVRSDCGMDNTNVSSWIGYATFSTLPANDNLADATDLNVGDACTGNSFNNAAATLESGEPIPYCISSSGHSVWYKFTGPASGVVKITTDIGTPSGISDAVMSLFKGPASGPTFSNIYEVACDDDGGNTNGTMPVISAGVEAGSTYYVRFASYGSNAGGAYCLEVLDGATASANLEDASSCSSNTRNLTTGADAFYNFQASSSGQFTFAINPQGQNLGTATGKLHISASTRFDAGGDPYLNRNFSITSTVAPTIPVKVRIYMTRLNWTDFQAACNTFYGSTPDFTDLRISHVAGADCSSAFTGTATEIAPTAFYEPPVGGIGWIEFETPSFSSYYVHSAQQLAPLPIELVSFSGKTMEQVNLLEWVTATERNVANHIVERSPDGLNNWTEIGRKTGLSASSTNTRYEIEDRAPLAKAFYRLRSVDRDGAESISNSVYLQRKGEQFGVANVAPNPTAGNVTVTFTAAEEGPVTLRIVDITGRIVLEKSTQSVEGVNALTLPLDRLQAGLYNLTMTNGVEISAPVRIVKN